MSQKQTVHLRMPSAGRSRDGAERWSRASIGARGKAMLLSAGLIAVTLVVGWLVWSMVEWGRGRTPGYRLTGLRVVRRSDGRPARFGRTVVRQVCCLVLVLPTLVVCGLVALAFVMGASAPDGLFRQARRAPWDLVAGTDVVSESGTGAARTAFILGEFPIDEAAAERTRLGALN